MGRCWTLVDPLLTYLRHRGGGWPLPPGVSHPRPDLRSPGSSRRRQRAGRCSPRARRARLGRCVPGESSGSSGDRGCASVGAWRGCARRQGRPAALVEAPGVQADGARGLNQDGVLDHAAGLDVVGALDRGDRPEPGRTPLNKALRSRTDERRATEVEVAVHVPQTHAGTGTLGLGSHRVNLDRARGHRVHPADSCNNAKPCDMGKAMHDPRLPAPAYLHAPCLIRSNSVGHHAR